VYAELKTNFKMAASVPFEDAFREVTRADTEGQQDSSNEESDERDETIESSINCFTQCSNLRETFALVKQGAKRYLRDLYEKHARGKDSLCVCVYVCVRVCELSLNTAAELKDEACIWFDLISL